MVSAGVVADANVLLSAATGKAALRVFSEYKIPVHTTRFNAEEVMEYLPRLSSKYEIPLELLQLQMDASAARDSSSGELQRALRSRKPDPGSAGPGRRSSSGAGPSPLPADLVERF